jgi:hypothetical protein
LTCSQFYHPHIIHLRIYLPSLPRPITSTRTHPSTKANTVTIPVTMAIAEIPKTMRAAVIYQAGGPEALKLETRPVPTPKKDEVLIQIKAFGL